MICGKTLKDGISNDTISERSSCDGLGTQKGWMMKELQRKQKVLDSMV